MGNSLCILTDDAEGRSVSSSFPLLLLSGTLPVRINYDSFLKYFLGGGGILRDLSSKTLHASAYLCRENSRRSAGMDRVP